MLGAIGGGVVLLVVIVLVVRGKGRKKKAPVADDTRGRARMKMRDELRNFRDDLKRAGETSAPVFKKIATETEHTDVVGHWRKTLKHRIALRVPNLGALKGTARTLGYDAQALIDLDAAWKKTGKMVADYNSGALDASRTPISTAKDLEKELQKMSVLTTMCMTKYCS